MLGFLVLPVKGKAPHFGDSVTCKYMMGYSRLISNGSHCEAKPVPLLHNAVKEEALVRMTAESNVPSFQLPASAVTLQSPSCARNVALLMKSLCPSTRDSLLGHFLEQVLVILLI